MKVTVFAKKRKTHDGRSFISYIGKLAKKDGSELTASIKFREDCGSPKAEDCPMIIEFTKDNANLSTRNYTDAQTGETKISYELWVSDWFASSEVYVDHSLDEFE